MKITRRIVTVLISIVSIIVVGYITDDVVSANDSNLIESLDTRVQPMDMITEIPNVSVIADSTLINSIEECIELQKEVAIKAELERKERLEREAAEKAEAERLAQIDSITANPDNVTELSNLTEEQFSILVQGTWWEGNEWILMEIEAQYHLNAMFAMSVSTLESGCGTTWRARVKQNYYGAEVPTYFEGLYDSSMYFGDFVNRLYIDEGLISVWAIGPKYCPPNRNWENYMYDYMNKLKNKVVETVR